jgi:hypothetical protein
LDIGSCEAGDRRFKLVRGLQKLKRFLLQQGWDQRGKVEIWRLDVVRMQELFQ